MSTSTRSSEWERLRRAVSGCALPLAVVDLDALEANVDRLTTPARIGGKRVRVATKSVRSPALLELIADAAGGVITGAMAYAATECPLLVAHGLDDILVAYPTMQPSDLTCIAEVNRDGATARLVVDCVDHVDAIAKAARDAGARIPVIVDVDVSYRPGGPLHLGVRRSPVREVGEVVVLAERIAARPELRFDGIMAYEAQIAGLADGGVATRALKTLSRPHVIETRAAVVAALSARGLGPAIVNGGGTGSLDANSREPALTEIAVGSGFLASHLFDHYRGLSLRPAAFFALQVVRKPAPGVVTCHGGGFIASGAPGRDRLPIPVFPEGLSLLDLEGAGEVQTPLRVPRGVELALGDPVFFRHAKAGELAEHVNEYILVRGDEAVGRAPTYRGMGKCFLG
ncbi:MAG: alanine racemase [Polyangiaceae bacterium]|jgi:D-serine deaminase-like pyridoxal phosphate-dependent protein